MRIYNEQGQQVYLNEFNITPGGSRLINYGVVLVGVTPVQRAGPGLHPPRRVLDGPQPPSLMVVRLLTM
jgi:hypothetical protein